VVLEHDASQGRCISWTLRAFGFTTRATLIVWVREVFPETRRGSTGAYGAGSPSDAVRRAAVVGLYSRKETCAGFGRKGRSEQANAVCLENQLLGPDP